LALDRRCFDGLWSAEGYRREIESPNSELFVFEGQELAPQKSTSVPTIYALGCYWAILEEAHITIVAVDPAYQQQGLGQAMLWVLLDSARGRGLERATLEVRASNRAAIALYTKFGFRKAGFRKRYYQDNGEDALILWQGGLQTLDYAQQLKQYWNDIRDRLTHHGWQLQSSAESPQFI
jgi:ribosomal-protein-alanine N-acetyltransferase